jgi:hypothetical protein
MLVTLIISILLTLFLFLVGFGLSRIIFKGESKNEIPRSTILGFAFLIYLSFVVVHYSLPLLIIYIGLVFLCLLSTIKLAKIAKQKKSLASKINLVRVLVFLFGSATFSIQHIQDLIMPGIRFRVGPDALGWSLAADYFRSYDNLTSLTSSIAYQSNLSDLVGFTSIQQAKQILYSLPSYNEQVQGEFLIGAKRIGLPSFVGFMTRVFDQISIGTLFWSLASCFAGLLSLLLFEFFSDRGFSTLVRVTGQSSILLSSVIIAPIVEGGVWHIFVITTFFLLLLDLRNFRAGTNPRSPLIMIIILTTYATTITSDVLIVVLLAVIVSVKPLLFRHNIQSILRSAAVAILLLTPSINSIILSLKARRQDSFLAGWSAARVPMLADFFNLTPWQEPNGFYRVGPNLFSIQFIYSILISIALVIVFFKIKNMLNSFTLIYLCASVIILFYFSFIILMSESKNSYITWKISWLVTLVIPFILFDYNESRIQIEASKKPNLRGGRRNNRRYQQSPPTKSSLSIGQEVILYFLLLSTIIQWCRFEASWFAGSNTTILTKVASAPESLEAQKLQMGLSKFDVVGSCVPWFQQISLIGDLRLIAPRIAGITPRKSEPARDQVIIVSSVESTCNETIEQFRGISPVFSISNLYFYKID